MEHPDRTLRDPDATTRADCHRLLAMVAELHRRGRQRIRACPSLSGSGGYWRCSITTADNVDPDRGLVISDFDRGAHYTSADGDCYFGWSDLRGAEPAELAEAFLERHGEIAAAGRGQDEAYATWFAELLGHAARGQFPIAVADWDLPADHLRFVAGPGADDKRITMPLPPARSDDRAG